MKTIFTIGYATKSLDEFLLCLKKNGINSVVDVRTSPFSEAFPMYNRDKLKAFLLREDIYYLSFADEFGARRTEKEVYVDSFDLKTESPVRRVSFEKVYELPAFKAGVSRIQNAYKKGKTVCFLCSEKYPCDCHRFIMVASFFKKHGFDVVNIVSSDNNLSYDQTIDLLAQKYDEEEKRFRHRHPNAGEVTLFSDTDTLFERYCDDFFWSKLPREDKLIRFGNMMIGYVYGGEEDD